MLRILEVTLGLGAQAETTFCSSCGRVHGRRLEGQGIWNGSLGSLCDLQLKPNFSGSQKTNLPDEGWTKRYLLGLTGNGFLSLQMKRKRGPLLKIHLSHLPIK